MSESHSARARPALLALQEADPGLALLSLWCAHRDAGIAVPAETAGRTIRYGPGFAALPAHEQQGLAAHHILHAALDHSGRRAALRERLGERFDAEVFQAAADALVNEAVQAAGHALPRPALMLTALLKEATGEATDAAAALARWDAESLYFRLLRAGPEGAEARAARALARSRALAPDLAEGEPGAAAQEEGPDRAALWRQHLARAMAAGRGAGRGIGTLALAEAALPPAETPWEVILRRWLARAAAALPSTSPTRPARAWLAAAARARAEGAPLPGFLPGRARTRPLPRIAVGLDTSSSIGAEERRLFLAEIAGIARRTGAEIHLIPFDAAPEPPRRLDPTGWQAELARLSTRTGGGTDFRPVLAAAAALSPAVVVMLTDLDGPAGRPPGPPVIWAVPDAGGTPPAPPFGRLLRLGR